MPSFEHYNPVRVVFRDGAFDAVGALDQVRDRRCMFLGYAGFDHDRLAPLHKAASTLFIHDEFEENPSLAFVRRIASRIEADNIDTILAVGGGSTIDTAKSSSYLSASPTWRPGDPPTGVTRCNIVAVPTTAGTGSEVSPYAILVDESGGKKILSDPVLYPAVAVCDPKLTHGMPRHVTANTGVDALSHVVEAFLNKKCDGFMNALALDALRLIRAGLPRALSDPDDDKARSTMMLAALEGGFLLAACGTVIVHALGYGMSKEWELPHGHANGLLLSSFVELMARKGSDRAKQILDVFDNELSGFIEETGIVRDPARHVLDDTLLSDWTEAGTKSYGINNGVETLSEDDVRYMLESSLS